MLFQVHQFFFFFGFGLPGNRYIRSVLLIGADSVVPLLERLEASGVKSVWVEVSQEGQKNKSGNNKRGEIGLLRAC